MKTCDKGLCWASLALLAFAFAGQAAWPQAQRPEFSLTNRRGRKLEIPGGETVSIDLQVRNHGESPVVLISLSVNEPEKWSVRLEPNEVVNLAPDASQIVGLVITPGKTVFADKQSLVVVARSGNVSRTTTILVTVVAQSGTWAIVGGALAAVTILAFVIIFIRTSRGEN